MSLNCQAGAQKIHSFLQSESEWAALKSANAKNGPLRMSCCGGPVTLRITSLGTRYFSHRSKGDCAHPVDAPEHMLAKVVIAQAIDRAGWNFDTTTVGQIADGSAWTADVMATQASRGRVAFQLEWGKQSVEETQRRQDVFRSSKVRGLWFMRHLGVPVERHTPAFGLAFDAQTKAFRVLLPSDRYRHSTQNIHALKTSHAWQQEIDLSEFVAGALSGRLKFAPANGSTVPVQVSTAGLDCWRCGKETQAIMNLSFDLEKLWPGFGDGSIQIYDFEDCSDWLAAALPAELLATHSVGAVKHRSSKTMGRSYLSNGCVHCDAILGKFYDHEVWHEAQPRFTIDAMIDDAWVQRLPKHCDFKAHVSRWWFDSSANGSDSRQQRRACWRAFGVTDFLRYWGKARPSAIGASHHLLACHSLDVAAVGRTYLIRHPALADWLTQASGFPTRQCLIDWVTFCLTLHDLGKFSASFQRQRPDLVAILQGSAPDHLALPEVRHDSLGYWLWKVDIGAHPEVTDLIGEGIDWRFGAAHWVQAVTGHHGQPPLTKPSNIGTHFPSRDRSAAWSFTRAMAARFLTPDLRAHLSGVYEDDFEERSQTVSWWIAGIAVLADWVGSDASVFTYEDGQGAGAYLGDPGGLNDYWDLAMKRSEHALATSGVLPVQMPAPQLFSALFPAIAAPSPLQHWASTVELKPGPQIHLLEDVTGAGKTEAAVMLAHRLMASGVADGFFIGLPTMSTANAMYSRISVVYERLFSGRASLALVQSKKDLVAEFAASVVRAGREEGDPRQADDTATSRCARWLADHNKRALLAPAGVGTIDQALLAALQSKHQSLRLLGLFRKVLIVDEVHACDAYMQKTLETLLEFHAAAGGSVILLSATLPARMKLALFKAYAKGRAATPVPHANSVSPSSLQSMIETDYPLVTTWPGTSSAPGLATATPMATRPDVKRTVRVRMCSDLHEVVAEIAQTLAKDKCVLWIRNTVGDALHARFMMLQAGVREEAMTLFHARFTLGDRLDTESHVLDLMGPQSTFEKRRGRLIIATQVAEQSLDVDADMVVSDLAPIDRLIQRAGRQYRHPRDARGNRIPHGQADGRGEACMWVFAPSWTEDPSADWLQQALPGTAFVYNHHGQMWLTAQQMQRGSFTMPNDARSLIEAVYGEGARVPGALLASSVAAEGERHSARAMGQMNSVKLSSGYERKGTDWLSDTSAPSRLGEETVEVVLGRWRGNTVAPWCDRPDHAWAYSTVRIARRLIDQAVEPTTAVRRQAIEAAKASMPGGSGGGGQWVILLALDLDQAGRWCVGAVGAPQGRSPGRQSTWFYDARTGLVQEKT